MADLEVENTLREIRERVLAGSRRGVPATTTTNGATAAPASTNGVEMAAVNGHAGAASEALARMDANLATTARAWSRLPPLLSYRRGAAARFELWFKRLVKRALHWFTWEQVNFNSAVHHALGDARAALAAQDEALSRARAELRAELAVELRALRAEAESDRARAAELQARLARTEAQVAEAQTRFESGGAQLRHAFAAGLERLADSQRAATAALREELRGELREELRGELREELRGELDARAEELRAETATRAEELRAETNTRAEELRAETNARAEELRAETNARTEALHAETNARAEELHAELRARADALLEEQRVCFKQLSLEAGETAVMHDRARRQLEARLEALEDRQGKG
ncbi:MAG TPA: hypothetical protein VF297_04770 [Pyrinomonadaceae bacterium]